MSNLNEEDIAEYMEGDKMTQITCSGILIETWDIEDMLIEWETLVDELSEKEIALYQWKTVYQIKADEIIGNTDFKSLYGANNQKVRDNHVKTELSDWHDTIKELEFSIDWIARRISFLRELVRTKRVLMEVKQ